jgi:hypothetical protein
MIGVLDFFQSTKYSREFNAVLTLLIRLVHCLHIIKISKTFVRIKPLIYVVLDLTKDI